MLLFSTSCLCYFPPFCVRHFLKIFLILYSYFVLGFKSVSLHLAMQLIYINQFITNKCNFLVINLFFFHACLFSMCFCEVTTKNHCPPSINVRFTYDSLQKSKKKTFLYLILSKLLNTELCAVYSEVLKIAIRDQLQRIIISLLR